MARMGMTALGGVVGREKRSHESVRGRPMLSLGGEPSLSPSWEAGAGWGEQ